MGRSVKVLSESLESSSQDCKGEINYYLAESYCNITGS